MSTVSQSINQLPLVDEIVSGDKLIIDNGVQTRRIDFDDFIIGLDNVTFASTISTNATQIAELSTSFVDLQYTQVPNIKYIRNIGDFPAPQAGVIDLEDNTLYYVTGVIDLTGNRLICNENTSIFGISTEISRLKSTGLVGAALISSEWSLPLRDITIESSIGLDLDASGNADQILDWFRVNFANCATIGTIANYSNVLLTNSSLTNSSMLTFDGTVDTIAFSNTLFIPAAGKTAVYVDPSAVITRRFRTIYSSFTLAANTTGVYLPAAATIDDSRFIMDTVNFAGSGSPTAGVNLSGNRPNFVNCIGVPNTVRGAVYYMTDNATTTSVGSPSTFYKVAGTTSPGDVYSQFSLSDNRATYTGSLQGYFMITANLSVTTGNNNIVAVRTAKNGTTRVQSTSKGTMSASGVFENITVQDVVFLNTGDYIEIFIANNSSATNITAQDLTFTIISVF